MTTVPTSRGVRSDVHIREAVRFGFAIALTGGAFLLAAAVWVSTCSGTVADPLACGESQLTLLALSAPAVLLAGGLWAFVRNYQNSRRNEAGWAWQGAGWALLALTLLALVAGEYGLSGAVVVG